MKAKYGTAYANERFLSWWNQQSFGASVLDARTFDAGFREYARANGFLSGLYGNGAALVQPLGVAADLAGATTDIGGGVAITGTVLKWVLPVAVLGVLAVYALPYLAPAVKRAVKK